ncbi:hypothetical protein PIB30_051732 [Stylosanthes scabra]|uniref:Uncharacterized protein n=1 Tax=Stylosanthes scabra TaxID=79078 RepID=A0ABU6SIP3_9FABA|nr:hypothetical protein [Stylosanthes scabra]
MEKERIRERKLEKRDKGVERKMELVEDLTLPAPPSLVRKREASLEGEEREGLKEFLVTVVLPCHCDYRAVAPQKPPSKWKRSHVHRK